MESLDIYRSSTAMKAAVIYGSSIGMASRNDILQQHWHGKPQRFMVIALAWKAAFIYRSSISMAAQSIYIAAAWAFWLPIFLFFNCLGLHILEIGF